MPFKEFEVAVEPTIQAWLKKGFPLVLDDIVKEAFKVRHRTQRE